MTPLSAHYLAGLAVVRQRALAPHRLRHRSPHVHPGCTHGGEFPGRKKMEEFKYSMPVAIGKVSKFKIIGYVGLDDETSIYKVWKTICNDPNMSEELLKITPEVKEWWVCRLDDEPVSLLSSAVEDSKEKLNNKKRNRRRNISHNRSSSTSKSPTSDNRNRTSDRRNNDGTKRNSGEKEEGVPGKDGLTSLERTQLKNCISPEFPAWSNLAPMFLLQPRHLHIYTGVKWGGVKEARYWSTQYDLQRNISLGKWHINYIYKVMKMINVGHRN